MINTRKTKLRPLYIARPPLEAVAGAGSSVSGDQKKERTGREPAAKASSPGLSFLVDGAEATAGSFVELTGSVDGVLSLEKLLRYAVRQKQCIQ